MQHTETKTYRLVITTKTSDSHATYGTILPAISSYFDRHMAC